MFTGSPLFDPDPTPTAAPAPKTDAPPTPASASGGATGGTPAAKPSSSKIKVGEKEYEPAELASAAEKAAQLAHATAVLFDGSKTPDERATAARVTLGASGYNDLQISQWISQNIKGEHMTDASTSGANPGTNPTPKPDPFEERLKGLEDVASAAYRSQVTTAAQRAIEAQLDSKQSLGVLLDAAKRFKTESELPKTREQITTALERELSARLGRRMDQSAVKRLPVEWIAEEAPKAAKSVAELFSAVIGDASAVGRSSETSAGATDPYSGIKRTPMPEIKKGQKMPSAAALEEGIQSWIEGELADAAVKHRDISTNKA